MAKFDNAKVGNKVWSSVYGWSKITKVDKTKTYGIEVSIILYDNSVLKKYYNFDGREAFEVLYPTLFWNEFHIPTEEEDKKPFDLVELLRENLKPKEFEQDTSNIEFYFSHQTNRWYWGSNIITQSIGVVYFEVSDKLSCVVDTLNDNKVTIQQLKQAYKILNWL